MRIPEQDEKVKVGPLTFVVRYDKRVSDTNGSFGLLNATLQEIILNPDMKDDKKFQCFLHEILHAIFYVTGLSRWAEDGKPSEEVLVHMVSMQLAQVLADNPHIFGCSHDSSLETE